MTFKVHITVYGSRVQVRQRSRQWRSSIEYSREVDTRCLQRDFQVDWLIDVARSRERIALTSNVLREGDRAIQRMKKLIQQITETIYKLQMVCVQSLGCRSRQEQPPDHGLSLSSLTTFVANLRIFKQSNQNSVLLQCILQSWMFMFRREQYKKSKAKWFIYSLGCLCLEENSIKSLRTKV